MIRKILLGAGFFGLAACSTPGKTAAPLVADKALRLTASESVSLSSLATGAAVLLAIQFIYDPLAPNWEIEEIRLSDDTFRYSLKMKRYHTGGAGEPLQVLRRRLVQLQHEQGYSAYQLVDYSEGIESQTLGARRFAEGTVKLVQRQEADSFLQNSR